MKTVRFAMVIHNHQPVGNFDQVIEKGCALAYHPFLDALDAHPDLRLTLHFSGPLLEWIEANDRALVSRIRQGVKSGRFELLGGGFGEPILTMLTDSDARDQIATLRRHLQSRYGADARGVWLAERVWESGLASILVDAGARYTVVDDFHFRSAGLRDSDLTGYYIVEDQGRLLRVFSGSEYLRYAIPFREPEETIEYLRRFATEDGRNVMVYADDGEKFGLWPETHEHVYVKGWLKRFLAALDRNKDWIRFTTLAESVDELPPKGRVYLPDASYREMLEWVLPADTQTELETLFKDLKAGGLFDRVRPFVRGGNWRNFKSKYVEAVQMYSRMMEVSGLVADRAAAKTAEDARRELYRAQCNCAYWHGVFGGLYMPFLRFAVYQHLLAAENLVTHRKGRPSREKKDFDLDGRDEIKLQDEHLSAYIKPDRGGTLYELDDRKKAFNLTAVMTRRREAYHQKLIEAARQMQHEEKPGGAAKSIHERVRWKEPGLEKLLQYDLFQRDSLIDHFYPAAVTPSALRRSEAPEWGDFVSAPYEVTLPASKASSVTLTRAGLAGAPGRQLPVTVAKRLSLSNEGSLEIRYVLSFPSGAPEGTLFGVEFNLGLMAGAAMDRNYFTHDRRNLGNLSTLLQRPPEPVLGLVDEWLGVELWLHASPDAGFWTYPVETVNDSEDGFERVYQGSAVIPFWPLTARSGEEQVLTLRLEVRHR